MRAITYESSMKFIFECKTSGSVWVYFVHYSGVKCTEHLLIIGRGLLSGFSGCWDGRVRTLVIQRKLSRISNQKHFPVSVQNLREITKLCCNVIRSTRCPYGRERPPGWPRVSPGCRMGPRGISDAPYHVTTRCYLYPAVSKMQNSINMYSWFWRRLTCPTQDFGNS